MDYGLQVQQRLQSCLFTSIKRIICKFRLLRNDQLLDIILQLVYAYSSRLGSAIDWACARLLVRGVIANGRSGLGSCSVRDGIWALARWLAPSTNIWSLPDKEVEGKEVLR